MDILTMTSIFYKCTYITSLLDRIFLENIDLKTILYFVFRNIKLGYLLSDFASVFKIVQIYLTIVYMFIFSSRV